MKFTGTARVHPRIKTLREIATLDRGDMKKMLTTFDTIFREHERKQFSSQGRTGGKTWPALSPDYAKWKKKKKPGRKIMTFSGKTRDAFSKKNHPNHVAWYGLNPTPYVAAGAHSKVAAYHAHSVKGNTLANPRLPDRNVIQATPRQYGRHHEAMKAYLITKLKRVKRALQRGAVW